LNIAVMMGQRTELLKLTRRARRRFLPRAIFPLRFPAPSPVEWTRRPFHRQLFIHESNAATNGRFRQPGLQLTGLTLATAKPQTNSSATVTLTITSS